MPYKNPEDLRIYQKHHRRKLRDERKTTLLKDAKCMDCGNNDIRVLDFHHRDPKEKELEIAKAWWYSLKRIIAEIEKCDVLCANCHRIRHTVVGQR